MSIIHYTLRHYVILVTGMLGMLLIFGIKTCLIQFLATLLVFSLLEEQIKKYKKLM